MKSVTIAENSFKNYAEEYNKKLSELKNICNNYLKNNNDKNFFEIGDLLNKLRYNQALFPKQIRNEKTMRKIKKASSSYYKLEKKLKAFNAIDLELLKNKKPDDQTKTKNFDTFLKLNKQSLTAKANKVIYDISSIQSPVFNDSLNLVPLENRLKKTNKKINTLVTKVEKKIRAITSNGKIEDASILEKIKKVHKNVDKLLAYSEIAKANNKGESKTNNHTKRYEVIANGLDKVQPLLENIDNSNNILKILKQGNSENNVVNVINNINKDLQSKQAQLIETSKSFIQAPRKSL
jgi:hypothetical protein